MDFIVGVVGAVVGSALSLVGIIVTNEYMDRRDYVRCREERIGKFIAEAEKSLRTGTVPLSLPESFGYAMLYFTREEREDGEAILRELSLRSPDPEKVRQHTLRLGLPDTRPRRWLR